MKYRQAASKLLQYIRPHKWGMVLSVVCFMLSAAVDPLLPALLKRLFDTGFKPDMGFSIWLVPLLIIGLFMLRGSLAFSGTYMLNWATSRAVLALRTDILRAVMRADANLYSTMSPGVVASRVINDPQNATQALAGATTTVLRDGTTLIAMIGYLIYLNWQLTLLSLATIPAMIYIVRRVQRRALRVGGRVWETQMRLIGIVDDVSRAWRVVRTFDAEDFERQRFFQEARQLQRLQLRNVAATASMTPMTQVVSSIGIAMIVTLALYQANQGAATVGEFVAFITALIIAIAPMRHLTDVTQPIVTGLVGAQACFALMDTPPEQDTGTRELEPDKLRGELKFDGVRVQYPGSEHRALDGLNLDIGAGKTIALVGPSGSGKSTAINAMLGFVAPTEGVITLDGVDVQDIRKASLRRQFAVVSQDIVLFDGPIADNVAYAQPKDAARVEAALRAANLWDFVQAQPDGPNATIGTNGSRLSGGQRQRLAIARALYKNARVWVFDEATSALDTESERVVQQSIEDWHGSKTLILIAHRLSTVRNADWIYVLAEGRVLESGRHDDLMALGGLYANMVRAQALD
ncbi:MAG TPA: ABC transporter transmembrane domain-containing protein [Rubrivivax sp.]|nr:ABC transporter transmembrane domain-containing protein [Rubrivivax sp.]